MPVSVFETEGESRCERIVTPNSPQTFRDYSKRKGDVILIASYEDDSLALIMRLSKHSLLQRNCAGFKTTVQLSRFATGLEVVRQGIEVVDYQPEPDGETALLHVQHISTTNN